MGRSRVVFIAICSGDPELIRRWTASGDMPAVAGLLARSRVAETRGLPGVYVGAHWPSWITGCTPARTGVHSWRQLRPGSYDDFTCRAGAENRRPPFWDALSAAGRRCCVLDVPHSAISPGINGLQTVEWGAHDGAFGFKASDPALEAEILERYGRHPVSGHSDDWRDVDQLIAFRDDLVRGAMMKGDLSRDFYRKEPWDFFAQVFTEAHCAGHLLWHWHDRSRPWPHGERPAEGDGLRDVYRAIDRSIGELLSVVDDDATVIFLANHGMTGKGHANHLLGKVLLKLGYAAPALGGTLPPSPRRGLKPMATWAWRKLPADFRDRARPWRERLWRAQGGHAPRSQQVDRAASLCFPVENNTAHGGIRVNLIGREPDGRVQPGAEYEDLLDRVTMDLMGLTNLETGGKVVAAVHRTDDLYPGPERHRLPDLLIEYVVGDPVRAVGSNRLEAVTGEERWVRSGEHTPDGLAAFCGPGWAPGRHDRTLSCVDFAPTIAELLEVDLPGPVDGRPVVPGRTAAIAGE